MTVALFATVFEVLRGVVSDDVGQVNRPERHTYREVQENLPRIKVFDVIFLENLKKTAAEIRASRKPGGIFSRSYAMRVGKLEEDSPFLLRRVEVDDKEPFALVNQANTESNHKNFDLDSTFVFEEKP